jgi:hypothetical protein
MNETTTLITVNIGETHVRKKEDEIVQGICAILERTEWIAKGKSSYTWEELGLTDVKIQLQNLPLQHLQLLQTFTMDRLGLESDYDGVRLVSYATNRRCTKKFCFLYILLCGLVMVIITSILVSK